MFVTQKQAETKARSGMLQPEQQGWDCVQQSLNLPWFHVTVVRTEQAMEVHSVVLVHNIQALKAILTPGVDRVKSIQLVSPGWINGTGDWRMEPLAAAVESIDGCFSRFMLDDDRVYSFPAVSSHCSGLNWIQTYPFSTESH